MISWLTIASAAALLIFNWFQEEREKGNLKTFTSFLRHSSVKLSAIILALIGVSLLVVNFVITPYQPETAQEKIETGITFENHSLIQEGFEELLESYPDSIALHFQYIEFMASSDIYERHHLAAKYASYSISMDPKKLFLGQLGTSLAHARSGNVNAAEKTLRQIPNGDQRYVNYIYGVVRLNMGHNALATVHFRQELVQNGYLRGAYRHLGNLLYEQDSIAELTLLLQEPEARKHVSIKIQDEIYFKDGEVALYSENLIRQVTPNINIAGFLAALLVMLAWLFYVRKLDIFEPEPWKPIILVLGMGILLTFLVFPISDAFEYLLEFSTNEEPLNDFLYCWFAIGIPEELVKIIPVLLLLKFSKLINEPYDYILYGSVAALGFAFTENLMYYSEESLSNISARALSSVVAHMFFTSIITYGMLLNEYKLKRNPILNFLFFFLLAALAHGFYDFWLMNGWAKQFAFLTIFFFLISVHFWAIFKNNALNNSNFYDPHVSIDNTNLKFFLTVSLVGIVMLEYILVAYKNSPEAANANLSSGVFYSGFLIFYISSNFSNFKIQRGKWMPLRVKLPFTFFQFTRPDQRDHSGLNVTLYNAKENHTTIFGLPAKGRLVEQRTVNHDPSWFLVQLEVNLGYPNIVQNMVLIRAKNKKKRIDATEAAPVEVMIIPAHSLLSEENIDTASLQNMGIALSVKSE